MTESHDHEETADEEPRADQQITDAASRADAEEVDPDAGPTATAEQVESDSERDQAEG